ncbi:LamG domain-containing protein [Aporhodopirellula aestuarii]|uniref:LamG domain-containing protein n=1 Tax=Aporhodopirellula aestuarii TaxID=2950107 RepID=A0ABT0TZI9_9BACT|nr:LamG domain-containing protein [Aporhodopirellula aestuarii]MCM2369980.1 LamG domain-containing protein [Aporhodopirellula aestuarii]
MEENLESGQPRRNMPRVDRELAELLSMALDGAPGEADFKKLQERLKTDPRARKHYIHHRLLEAGVAREMSVDAVGGMVDQIGFGADAGPSDAKHSVDLAIELAADIEAMTVTCDQASSPETGQGRSRFGGWLMQHAAVIAPWVMLVGGCVAVLLELRTPSSFDKRIVLVPPPVEVANADLSRSLVTAMLVDEAGAKFADDRSTEDVVFKPGEYELLEGTVHLRFASGVDLVMKAPARLAIDDLLHTRLAFGAVRAIVPPSAVGFTIKTDDVNFEDVGTEFGLNVSKKTGESTMQVFDGQVNVRESKTNDLMKSVYEGDWVRYADGESKQGGEPDASQFPSPGEIGFLRWKAIRQQQVDDPSLIGWFPFVKQEDTEKLVNVAPNSRVTAGRISGPRWVSGRWAGKDALLFDRDSDFVEFEILGEYQEITVGVWMQVDRLDREMIAICNSNQGDDGDLHFQMNRYGLPRGGIMGAPRSEIRWVGDPVPLGKWVHVLSVTSIPKRRSDIYVNGEIVTKSALGDGDYDIRPGVCRLGNWVPFAQFSEGAPRALSGRMDEVAIWKRALSDEEISTLVDEGRPSLVWSRENPPLAHPLPKP